MVPAHRQLAFTMLELLVVISIMSILAAMILVGAQKIGGNAQVKKTDTIIQTVRSGIELAIANKGSAISPTEHPFAGSRDSAGGQRFKFVRMDGSTISSTGLALKGVPNTSLLISDQNKLLMQTDRFADERIPLLYGALREDIGVLQSLRKVVTKYRMLPMPPKPPVTAPPTPWKVISPVTNKYNGVTYSDSNKDTDHPFFPNTLIPTKYQDENKDSTGKQVDPPFGTLGDSKLALDYLFGNSNAQAELASLKAIFNADPTLPDDVNTYKTGIEMRNGGGKKDIAEALVYTNYGSPGQIESNVTKSKYEPGYLAVGTASGGKTSLATGSGGKWVKYRIGGMAVYDAWGNELMTVSGENNSYRVVSAGIDGVLMVNPGKNLTWDTKMTGKLQILTFKEDDKDGSKDNQK